MMPARPGAGWRSLLWLVVLLLGAACAPGGAPAAAPTPAGDGQAPTPTAAPPLLTAAPTATLAAAPVASTPGSAAPLNPPVKVRVGFLSLATEVPTYLALDRGYFQQEGLDVDLVPFSSGNDQIAPLTGGQLEVGSLSPDAALFNAIGRGIGLKLVEPALKWATGSNGAALVVRQDLIDSGAYTGPASLRGMTISMPTLTSSGRLYIERILAQGGLTDDDVTLTQLGFADAGAALANKKVDASWLGQPFLEVVRDKQIASVAVSAGDIVPTGSVTILMVFSPSFAEQQPEASRRYVTAWLRGSRDAWLAFEQKQGSPEGAITAITRHTPLKDAELVRAVAQDNGLVGFSPNGGLAPEQVSIFQDFFVKNGAELAPVDLNQAIDNSYNQYALQRLGSLPQ
jgi:NitT/TauT family transport system substrate-binding protein